MMQLVMMISILRVSGGKFIETTIQARPKLGAHVFASVKVWQSNTAKTLRSCKKFFFSEICVARKKIFFVILYRSPSQNSAEYENFIDGLQLVVTRIQNENPYSLTIMGDFHCRSNQVGKY